MESRKIRAEMITEIIKFNTFILERRNLLVKGVNKCAEGHSARSLSAKSLPFLLYYVSSANKVLGHEARIDVYRGSTHIIKRKAGRARKSINTNEGKKRTKKEVNCGDSKTSSS